jgi:calcineurin-like phosphoesterase family protein
MAKTFFTSDLHIGHVGVAKSRGFSTTDEHDERIIANWNAVVGVSDEVWVLGDVALGAIAESLPKVGRLNGRKFLVCGNHDRISPAYPYESTDKRSAAFERLAPRYRELFSDFLIASQPTKCGGAVLV